MKHKIRTEYYRLVRERADNLKAYQDALDKTHNAKLKKLQEVCEETGHNYVRSKCMYCGKPNV